MGQYQDIDYDLKGKLNQCVVPNCPFVASLHSELCLQHRTRELNYDSDMSAHLKKLKIEEAIDRAWESMKG